MWTREKRRERTSLASHLALSSSTNNKTAEPVYHQTQAITEEACGSLNFILFLIPCALPAFPCRDFLEHALSLRQFPLRGNSSPPGAKSSPLGAKSSSFNDDLSSPHNLFYDFPSVVTLALESDVSPVEEKDGAAASDFLSIHPHDARGTIRVLRAWVFPYALFSFQNFPKFFKIPCHIESLDACMKH
jgi:hypothetical protein